MILLQYLSWYQDVTNKIFEVIKYSSAITSLIIDLDDNTLHGDQILENITQSLAQTSSIKSSTLKINGSELTNQGITNIAKALNDNPSINSYYLDSRINKEAIETFVYTCS